MSFANTWVLHLLWCLPLLVFLLIVKNRLRRRALQRYADPDLRARLAPPASRVRRNLKSALLLCALALLILALAGPRWGSRFQEVTQKGVDIMLLVDVSRSMMVEDIKPNRLKRAGREIVDFLKVVRGDRVGLVAFAGTAFVQCPLTLDYAALEMFIKALQPGLIPVPGTDLGAALDAGLGAFDFEAQTDKVMLLITDGEDNEKRAQDAAAQAAAKGVKIFVFGMGDPAGGPIPAGENKGGFQKDQAGKLVLSKLDESGLKALAQRSGGGYVRSVAGDLDLDVLYFEGIKQTTQDQALKSGKIRIFEERFYLFILAALLLLILEGSILERSDAKTAALLAALTLSGLLLPPAAFAAGKSPDELYRAGRYHEAEPAYNRLDMENPKELSYRFNRGCAAFQGGRAKEAGASFASVLRRARDPKLLYKAAYNLGATAMKKGDMNAAAAFYRQALKHDPQNPNARYNLELALRAIKKQKEQQKQNRKKSGASSKDQKNQGKNGEQKPDGDQKKSGNAKDKPGQPKADKPDKGQSAKPGDQKQQAQSQPGRDKNSGQDRAGQKPKPQDLSGNLKALNDQSQQEQKQAPQPQARPDYEKKKAEALLDNIKEDPGRLLRFANPDKKQTASGKDW